MKNRRVLYIFLTLLLIVFIVLFSSVLFSVKTANIDYTGDSSSIGSEQIDAINTYFNKTIGKNIFFIDENTIIKELEKDYPYINISSIERIFPSEIILHFTDRIELFAIKTSAESYAVIDNFGKVVAIKEQNDSNFPIGDITDNVILNVSGDISAEVSDKLSNSSIQLALQFYGFYYNLDGFDITDFRGFADEITVNSDNILIKTRFGATINIVNCGEELQEKTRLAAGLLESLTESERTSAQITITAGNTWIK